MRKPPRISPLCTPLSGASDASQSFCIVKEVYTIQHRIIECDASACVYRGLTCINSRSVGWKTGSIWRTRNSATSVTVTDRSFRLLILITFTGCSKISSRRVIVQFDYILYGQPINQQWYWVNIATIFLRLWSQNKVMIWLEQYSSSLYRSLRPKYHWHTVRLTHSGHNSVAPKGKCMNVVYFR